MALYLIGIGLSDEKDISVKGLEAVRKCSKVYLENYTSVFQASIKKLEKFYGKKIIPADRDLIENKIDSLILPEAKKANACILFVGDPLSATTHIDILLMAKKMNVKTEVVHNVSIINAVGITGLQVYKFGKTTSIPFPEKNWMPETPYDVLKSNLNAGLHTLFLLDLRPNQNKFMTVRDAIEYLLKVEERRKENIFNLKTMCVGVARIGAKNQKIKFVSAEDLMKIDFGKPLHSLIVPGELHFMEKDALEGLWR